MAGEQQIASEIRQISAADELGESFLPYSLSVITSRALPDVRDGLKPVQRRIIVAMNDLLMRPGSPYRKSAKVVGDTMGNYHPHGDSAIYEAMVRMGQTFSMSVPLIDPHGNFGTLDDPPAASRYTECRLTAAAMEMIGELSEDTVDYRPTYDGENEEPEYLPSRMPNLLVNGSSGIAVGMATNMAPHNLSEVCQLLELIMTKRRPKPTVDELMEVLPGPDFPTGGVIIDDGGIRQAYETGRGIVRMRAVAEIAQVNPRRNGIIVTELPYNVGPERVIKRVQELVKAEKLHGIYDFKNLSDKHHGMRLQIECKTGVNPRAVLADLFRLTPMEETFGINNVVLVDGRPTTVSLYDLGRLWIEHRIDVVIRRTEFRLAKAEARAHIVEGLLIALDAIDLVVSIIRTSADTATARARLMEQLSLSEIQADSILEMPLRRLTELANLELTAELEELRGQIEEYDKILMSDQRRRTIVLNEIRDVADLLGGPRRTKIVHEDEAPVFLPDEPISTVADVEAEPCIITLSSSGLVGREQADGSRNGKLGRHDVIVGESVTTTTSIVRAITSTGRVLTVQAAEIPAVAGRSRGASARELFAVTRGEDVLGVFADISPDGDGPASTDPVVLVTAAGVAKRVTAEELTTTATGMSVIKLKDRDALVAAFSCPEDADVAMVSIDAQILRTAGSGISVQGRNASGVAGMKLREGANVIMAARVHPEGVLLTTTDADTTKLTPLDEIPAKGRGGSGVRITRFRDFETQLWHAYLSPTRRVVAIVGSEDAPSKPDSDPIDLDVEISKRDAVSVDIGRRVLVGGKARW